MHCRPKPKTLYYQGIKTETWNGQLINHRSKTNAAQTSYSIVKLVLKHDSPKNSLRIDRYLIIFVIFHRNIFIVICVRFVKIANTGWISHNTKNFAGGFLATYHKTNFMGKGGRASILPSELQVVKKMLALKNLQSKIYL